jgi:hypothetical protein
MQRRRLGTARDPFALFLDLRWFAFKAWYGRHFGFLKVETHFVASMMQQREDVVKTSVRSTGGCLPRKKEELRVDVYHVWLICGLSVAVSQLP